MEILKHGKNPNNEALYFICNKCECEFTEKRKYCKYDVVCNRWMFQCPDCGNSINGVSYETYCNRTKIKPKTSQTQLEFLGY